MTTFNLTIHGTTRAKAAIDYLFKTSQWFSVEPWSDGDYYISVRAENEELLRLLADGVKDVFPAPRRPIYMDELLGILEHDRGRAVSEVAGYSGSCELVMSAEKLAVQLRKACKERP